jgi:hypothetical protein
MSNYSFGRTDVAHQKAFEDIIQKIICREVMLDHFSRFCQAFSIVIYTDASDK